MRVITCYSPNTTETTVMRGLVDNERRVVISARWGEPLGATFAAVRHLLTEEEAAAVASVFGLNRPGGRP
jgi:hypothetical protein